MLYHRVSIKQNIIMFPLHKINYEQFLITLNKQNIPTHMYEVPPNSAMGVQFSDNYCRYRHSYPPVTNIALKRKGTASIPIARQATRKTASENRIAQDEAEADYKDFIFFSRVVDGISKQNSLLQDGSYLKSTNETLLDNIVRARHELQEKEVEVDDGFHNHYYYPTRLQQIHHDLKIVTPTRDDPSMNSLSFSEDCGGHHLQNDYEDEGVFDFEL
jgi:hypothetical protein